MLKNIILIGMRGSGKTTISRLLSKKLKIKIIDTDKEIEEKEKKKIKEIANLNGWEYFRDKETEVLKNLNLNDILVLSTGGGIILRDENCQLLKKIGTVFYLKAKPETSYKRIGEDNNRPLLTGSSTMLNDLINLYQNRKELYEKTADYIIDTERLNIKQVVNVILKHVKLSS